MDGRRLAGGRRRIGPARLMQHKSQRGGMRDNDGGTTRVAGCHPCGIGVEFKYPSRSITRSAAVIVVHWQLLSAGIILSHGARENAGRRPAARPAVPVCTPALPTSRHAAAHVALVPHVAHVPGLDAAGRPGLLLLFMLLPAAVPRLVPATRTSTRTRRVGQAARTDRRPASREICAPFCSSAARRASCVSASAPRTLRPARLLSHASCCFTSPPLPSFPHPSPPSRVDRHLSPPSPCTTPHIPHILLFINTA